MTKNVGEFDRVMRIAGGAFASSMAFWGPKNPWFLGFLLPVATGFTQKCPIYNALGINTCKKEEQQAYRYLPVQSTSELAAGIP